MGKRDGAEITLESDLVLAVAPANLFRRQAAVRIMSTLRELFPVALEVQTGEPPEAGRYVVFTPCRALQAREYCEPSIATWHGGRWHSYEPVWGWIGPLPVVHGDDCLKARTKELWPEGEPELGGQEYDL